MTKYIKDPIYPNYLQFTKTDLRLIDNIALKRLTNIKQLGSLYEVFPGATHTRFLHSLGVAHLAETFTTTLLHNSNICIDSHLKKDIRNIKMAGLYHDVGHGPFSHVFDNHVLNKLCPNNIYKEHEIRSCDIIEKTCNKLFDSVIFNGYDIDNIKQYINPENKLYDYRNQIVSNKINSIDVDKFDYLKRDPYYIGFTYAFDYTRLSNKVKIINNDIHYHEDVVDDLFDMYYTRYKLHREIYNHKTVKSIELMIGDILLYANEEYNFPSILDHNDFLTLDDTILSRIKYNPEKSLDKCRKLINRIDTRDNYKQIYISNTETIGEIKDIILDSHKDNREDEFHFIKMKFNLCNGEKSPIDNIKFYNKNGKMELKNMYIRKLIPEIYDETVVRVYKK